jgi:hypothetical protein
MTSRKNSAEPAIVIPAIAPLESVIDEGGAVERLSKVWRDMPCLFARFGIAPGRIYLYVARLVLLYAVVDGG